MTAITQLTNAVEPYLALSDYNTLPRDTLANCFQGVLSAYEKKANRYINSCLLWAKRIVEKEPNIETHARIVALQRILDYGHGIPFEQNGFCVVISFIYLLKEVRPELLVSTGLSTQHSYSDLLANCFETVTRRVFVCYMARRSLFSHLGPQALRE